MIFRSLTAGRANRAAYGDRLPPGQTLTTKWPVLHYGSIPRSDPFQWDFTISGLVAEPVTWKQDAFRALPRLSRTLDASKSVSRQSPQRLSRSAPMRTHLCRVSRAFRSVQ